MRFEFDSSEVLDNLTGKVLMGNWGDSTAVRLGSQAWYEGLGISGLAAASGRLHPIVEYAANCLYDQTEPDVDTDAYLLSCSLLAADSGPTSWIAGDSPEDDALTRVVVGRLDAGTSLRHETVALRALLEDAVKLIRTIAPVLGGDAISYTRRHYFVATDSMIGRTWTDTCGLTITGDPALESLAQFAESLFHESMHSKFSTIERGLQVPVPDEVDAPKPVVIPWQHYADGRPHQWTIYRTVDAYYVYVHLGLYRWAQFLQTRSVQDLQKLRRACFRGAYLSARLQESGRQYALDDERMAIAEWLDECRVPEFDLNEAGRQVLRRSPAAALG